MLWTSFKDEEKLVLNRENKIQKVFMNTETYYYSNEKGLHKIRYEKIIEIIIPELTQ